MAAETTPTRILVLISGNGTNLQALIDATNTPKLPTTTIIRVISNRKDAYGLTRAQKAGIPTSYHNLVRYNRRQTQDEAGIQAAREEYDSALGGMIVAEKPDLVVCAGWMHILSSQFIDMLSQADVGIINLHPALPGQFNGAGAIERAYEKFETTRGQFHITGVMMHHVISEVDMGDPILTQEVEIMGSSSLSDLGERIHKVEHELIVEGTRKALDEIISKRRAGGT